VSKFAPQGTAVWILRRVLIRDLRRAGGRLAALAIGAVVVTLLGLSTMAAVQVIGAHQERSRSLGATVADPSDRTDDGLSMVNPELLSSRRWDGHSVTRNYFVGDGTGPAIPGVSRVPDRDEYFASPALSELLKTDGSVAQLFAGRRLAGTITPTGLIHPHELRAVLGTERDQWALVPVVGFGDPAPSLGDDRLVNLTVGLLVAGCVWVPGVAFLIVGSRLATTERRRRARQLHALGMSTATVKVLHGSEVGVTVAAGGVLGAMVFHVWIRRVTAIPGTDTGYFTADADPGLLATVVVLAVVVLVAGAAAASAVDIKSGASRATTRPRRQLAPSIQRAGRAVLLSALVYLLAMPVLVQFLREGAVFGMWLAALLCAGGLAIVGPDAVARTYRSLVPKAKSAGNLVGLRLQTGATTTSLRLGSLLAVIIVLVLGALSFISVLEHGGQARWAQTLRENPQLPLVATDINGTLTLDTVEAAATSPTIQTIVGRVGKTELPVLVGRCDSLGALGGKPPSNCDGTQPQWVLIEGRERATPPRGTSVNLPSATQTSLDLSATNQEPPVTVSDRLPTEWQGALFIPSRTLPTLGTGGTGSTFFMLVDGSRLTPALAALSGQEPTIQFDLGGLTLSDPDAVQFPTQVAWLTTGASLALVIGVLGLFLVVVGEVRQRSAQLRGLRSLGAARPQVLLAHALSSGVPITLVGLAGVSTGLLVTFAMHSFDDRARIDLAAAAVLALGCLLAGATLTILTIPNALKQSDRSGGFQA